MHLVLLVFTHNVSHQTVLSRVAAPSRYPHVYNGISDIGAHAFSADGVHWVYSKVAAYSHNIQQQDGSVYVAARRERPFLLLDSGGAPTHLYTGVRAWAGKTHSDVERDACVVKRMRVVQCNTRSNSSLSSRVRAHGRCRAGTSRRAGRGTTRSRTFSPSGLGRETTHTRYNDSIILNTEIVSSNHRCSRLCLEQAAPAVLRHVSRFCMHSSPWGCHLHTN